MMRLSGVTYIKFTYKTSHNVVQNLNFRSQPMLLTFWAYMVWYFIPRESRSAITHLCICIAPKESKSQFVSLETGCNYKLLIKRRYITHPKCKYWWSTTDNRRRLRAFRSMAWLVRHQYRPKEDLPLRQAFMMPNQHESIGSLPGETTVNSYEEYICNESDSPGELAQLRCWAQTTRLPQPMVLKCMAI